MYLNKNSESNTRTDKRWGLHKESCRPLYHYMIPYAFRFRVQRPRSQHLRITTGDFLYQAVPQGHFHEVLGNDVFTPAKAGS